MLASFTVIVLFEVTGDLLQAWLQLPIPGPVIGMGMLLAALIGRGRLPDGLECAANGLLRYLPMMFVPAGVGAMAHFDLIRAEWRAIAVALAVSSVLAVIVTALAMRGVERVLRSARETVPIPPRNQSPEGAG
jgi:holin-like protein